MLFVLNLTPNQSSLSYSVKHLEPTVDVVWFYINNMKLNFGVQVRAAPETDCYSAPVDFLADILWAASPRTLECHSCFLCHVKKIKRQIVILVKTPGALSN